MGPGLRLDVADLSFLIFITVHTGPQLVFQPLVLQLLSSLLLCHAQDIRDCDRIIAQCAKRVKKEHAQWNRAYKRQDNAQHLYLAARVLLLFLSLSGFFTGAFIIAGLRLFLRLSRLARRKGPVDSCLCSFPASVTVAELFPGRINRVKLIQAIGPATISGRIRSFPGCLVQRLDQFIGRFISFSGIAGCRFLYDVVHHPGNRRVEPGRRGHIVIEMHHRYGNGVFSVERNTSRQHLKHDDAQ